MRSWKSCEIEVLKKHHKNKSDKELADLLDRSISSIKNKRYNLGLTTKKNLFQNIYNYYRDGKLIETGTISEIAASTGLKLRTILNYTSKETKGAELELVNKTEPDFALYKGEEILAIGTISEIAEKMEISPATVQYYGQSAYIEKKMGNNSRILIEIEED